MGPGRHRPGATGILPFRFAWQAVARQTLVVCLYFHSLGILAVRVRQVAPLVCRDLLLLAEPVAVSGGIVPSHRVYWRVLTRTRLLLVFKARETHLELGHSYQLRCHSEGIVNLHRPALLIISPTPLIGWRT